MKKFIIEKCENFMWEKFITEECEKNLLQEREKFITEECKKGVGINL